MRSGCVHLEGLRTDLSRDAGPAGQKGSRNVTVFLRIICIFITCFEHFLVFKVLSLVRFLGCELLCHDDKTIEHAAVFL